MEMKIDFILLLIFINLVIYLMFTATVNIGLRSIRQLKTIAFYYQIGFFNKKIIKAYMGDG